MENSKSGKSKRMYIFRVVSYALCLFPLGLFIYRGTINFSGIVLAIVLAVCLILQFNSTFRGGKQTAAPMIVVGILIINEVTLVLDTFFARFKTNTHLDISAYALPLIGIVILIIFVYATGAKRKEQNNIKDGIIDK